MQIDSLINQRYTNITEIQSSIRSCVYKALDENFNKVILKSFIKSPKYNSHLQDKKTKEIIPKELFYLHCLNRFNYVPELLNFHNGQNWSTVVMEYLDNEWMELFYYIRITNTNEEIKKIILRNVLVILYHMAEQGFYHLDIKPENIMVNEKNLHIKLIDFENVVHDLSTDARLKMNNVGTVGYKSPESYNSYPVRILPSLVFTFGCLIYGCLEVKRPYLTEEQNTQHRFFNFEKSSNIAISLIQKCTNPNMEDRIDFFQILNDEWFQNYV